MPGVFARIGEPVDPNRCFVMMPFAESFDAIYRLIERCCKEQGLVCERADTEMKPGKITDKIYAHVKRAGVVVADLTGRNPNVFYELGLAHAISDNVILLTQSPEDVPFDLRDFLHVRYTNSFGGAEKLANDVSKMLTQITRSAASTQVPEGLPAERPLEASEQALEEVVELGTLHLQAELARHRRDLGAARRFLLRAQELAKSGEGDANDIGNCAIEAESCKFRTIAEDLYERALTRNPTHVNNLQCYVSFILDEYPTDPKRLQRASAILATLDNLPERKHRTMALHAQYASCIQATGRGTAEDLDQMMADLEANTDFSSLHSASPALVALESAGELDRFRRVVEKVREHVTGQEALDCGRVLADALAKHGEAVDQQEAIRIYESIVAQGGATADLMHNLASLLMHQGTDTSRQRAAEIWREAYRELHDDNRVRHGFAQCLIRLGRQDEAESVLRGEPLS